MVMPIILAQGKDRRIVYEFVASMVYIVKFQALYSYRVTLS